MSQDTSASGASDQSSGVDQDSKPNSVQYSTYQKVLSEAKSAKERLRELEQKEVEREEKRLLEQGELKALLEKRDKELKELAEKRNKEVKAFGYKVFSTEAKQVALEMGANPEALEDIIKVGDFNDVEIGDDFTPNKDQLKSAISKMQQSKPFYFKKNVSATKDVNTQATMNPVGSKKIEDMTVSDLMKLAQELDKKK